MKNRGDVLTNSWLIVVRPKNYEMCMRNNIMGTYDFYLKQIKKTKIGDEIYLHIKGMKAGGIFKVTKEYFVDKTDIGWDEEYPHRIGIEPVTLPDSPINIKEFFQEKFPRIKASGYFRRAWRPMPSDQFELFKEFIEERK